MAAKKKPTKKAKRITLAALYRKAKRDAKLFKRLLENPKAALRDAGLSLSTADARRLQTWTKRKPFQVKASNKNAFLILGDAKSWKFGPISWPAGPWDLGRGPLNPWKDDGLPGR